ncbi:MAG: bifunctional (p)ppGpp synthetase/guanosine-3',5'-bis(diphosphate) 3'-pyrophosphohydrolase [Alphaproteobacteria bacterium]|nr:bifunctional (p)ppGpp synthetase/guanosine-3',5'-bis(diphosphate) 3'-pyrophosphohydrolase [Alphaproteobacteria bacterium]
MRQYELIEKVKSYQPSADEDSLIRAYVLASKVHHDQRRESGEPYFYHPTSVAQILIEYKMDADTIMAALLHDTVEDTPTAYQDIETLFSHQVADLVEGVTKLNKIQLIDEDAKQAQNFQELVLATSKDIRILMIKMADRLHNMRTLSACNAESKRKRIAMETLNIYVPLAERIGLHKIKTEMEDLCFQNLYPEAYQKVVKQLNDFESKGKNKINTLIRQFQKLLNDNKLKAEVIGRKKSPYSVWKKLQKHNGAIEEIFDIIGLRVLVKKIPDCYKALGIIHTNFHAIPGGRFKDYISNPKDSGYRSLHTSILGPNNQRLEIQIRTYEMNQEADFGLVAHWEYKQGFHRDAKQYQWMKELLDLIATAKNPKEFLEHTKMALYQDKIFVFSEQGQLFSLKRGATVLDFAYQMGVNLGNTCIGANVNGHKESIGYVLKDGESIHLLTGKVQPDKSWLNQVVTAQARSKILANLRQQQTNQKREEILSEIKKACDKAHLNFTKSDLKNCLKPLKYKSVEALLDDTAKEKITVQKILNTMYPNIKSTFYQRTLGLFKQFKKTPQIAPILGLAQKDKFTLGTCCHPVVGESIVAIETKKNQYVIHTRDCGVLGQYKKSPEKWVAVEWNLSDKNKNQQPARIQIIWKTGPKTMGSVLDCLTKQKVHVAHINTMAQTDKTTEVVADIQVKNSKHLKVVMEKLQKHPKIVSVAKENGQ